MKESENIILSVFEVAHMLKTHPNIVRRLLNEKKIYGFKCGKSWKIPLYSYERYIRQGDEFEREVYNAKAADASNYFKAQDEYKRRLGIKD